MYETTCCGYADIDEDTILSSRDIKRICNNHNVFAFDYYADCQQRELDPHTASHLNAWLGY